jgi:hypothetical protein
MKHGFEQEATEQTEKNPQIGEGIVRGMFVRGICQSDDPRSLT